MIQEWGMTYFELKHAQQMTRMSQLYGNNIISEMYLMA